MANKNQPVKTIFKAGITAGILDIAGAIILYAFILDLTTTQRVLQAVAAGALGKEVALKGGWNTALAGLAFHMMIALIFAAFYYLIYPIWTKLFRNKWVAGFMYGAAVWAVMNMLVLPIANDKTFTFDLKNFLYGISLIIFLVGIPISLITHKNRS